jgi:hypothetical protein
VIRDLTNSRQSAEANGPTALGMQALAGNYARNKELIVQHFQKCGRQFTNFQKKNVKLNFSKIKDRMACPALRLL